MYTLLASIHIFTCVSTGLSSYCNSSHGYYIDRNIIVATSHGTDKADVNDVGVVVYRNKEKDIVFIKTKTKGKPLPCADTPQTLVTNFALKNTNIWEGSLNVKGVKGDSGSQVVTSSGKSVGMLVGLYSEGNYFGPSCAEIKNEYETYKKREDKKTASGRKSL